MLFSQEVKEMQTRGIKEFVVREHGHKNLYYPTLLKAQQRIYRLNSTRRKGIVLQTVF